jgi:hypothetical protein
MNLPFDFLALVTPEPNSGCWLWEGYVSPSGYGRWRRRTLAHRVAYEAARGPVPNGLVLDHKCRVRCCVNPDHLEAVTNKVNVLRGEGFVAVNARKTHCVNGHELTEENTRIRHRNGSQRRVCRLCQREFSARHRAKLDSALTDGGSA